MTLMKNTKITDRLNMEIRWEVYNILNRGNFYYFPDNTSAPASVRSPRPPTWRPAIR